MPGESVRAGQLAALQSLVAALLERNPFYRRKLAAAGIVAPPSSLAEFSARFPFTTKAELCADQEAAPPFGANLSEPLERYIRLCLTSGTTGRPLRWLDTPESWQWLVGNWRRILRESGVVAGDRVFFAFSFGPFLGFWTAFEAAAQEGCLCLPGGGMSTAARLGAILDHEATVLCCTPTYALRLLEAARECGADLRRSRLRLLLAAGEPGASIPATRARLEAGWPGLAVRDHHGMTEVGPVSYESAPGVLRIMEAGYYAEALDPVTLQPAAPGELAELVLTPLGRTASPLLRYRTGDLVRTLPDDGGDLALDGGIVGRVDDMALVRGVNLYPSAMEAVLRRFDEVAEYRVELRREREMTEIEVAVEPAPGAGEDLPARVAEALREAFHLRIPVHSVAPGDLPRFELKASRWTRK